MAYACSVKSVLMMPVRLQAGRLQRRGVGILPLYKEAAAGLPWAFPFSLSLSVPFLGLPLFLLHQYSAHPLSSASACIHVRRYNIKKWMKTENVAPCWPYPSPSLLARWTVTGIQRSFCASGIFPCGPSHPAASMFSLLRATFMFYFTFYIG